MGSQLAEISDLNDQLIRQIRQHTPQSTGQRLQRPLIAFDAWLLALGR
jgi:hypothetical protein